jgi:hypothetical protein
MGSGSRYRPVTFIVTAIASAVLAACGSSGSSAALSQAEYLKQGNEICKKGLEEKDQAVKAGLESIPRSEFPNLSKQSLKMLGETALASYQEIMNELAELSIPAKDKAKVERILAEFEGAAKKTEANPVSLAQGDPFREAGDAAAAYGLKDCNF